MPDEKGSPGRPGRATHSRQADRSCPQWIERSFHVFPIDLFLNGIDLFEGDAGSLPFQHQHPQVIHFERTVLIQLHGWHDFPAQGVLDHRLERRPAACGYGLRFGKEIIRQIQGGFHEKVTIQEYGWGASSERLHLGGGAEELEDLLDVDAGGVVEAVVAEDGAEGFAGGDFFDQVGREAGVEAGGEGPSAGGE